MAKIRFDRAKYVQDKIKKLHANIEKKHTNPKTIRDEAQREIDEKVGMDYKNNSKFNFDNNAVNGEWKTIRGRRVFILPGETATEAITRSKIQADNSRRNEDAKVKELKKLDKRIEAVKKHQAKIDEEVADRKRKKKYFL